VEDGELQRDSEKSLVPRFHPPFFMFLLRCHGDQSHLRAVSLLQRLAKCTKEHSGSIPFVSLVRQLDFSFIHALEVSVVSSQGHFKCLRGTG
jgi:hypothetical protein